MSLIDKDKAVNAIAMYLFINDAIKSTEPMKVADYKVFAESILSDVPEIDIDTNVWCEDCKEYDKEHHNCPRFNRVIRTALNDADMVRVVRCRDCKRQKSCMTFEGLGNYDGYCSMGESKATEINTDCSWK